MKVIKLTKRDGKQKNLLPKTQLKHMVLNLVVLLKVQDKDLADLKLKLKLFLDLKLDIELKVHPTLATLQDFQEVEAEAVLNSQHLQPNLKCHFPNNN